MITLTVPDMSCGHCKAAVEKAVASVDPAATVTVDLPARTVAITSTAPTETLIAALATEGYPARVA
jgi:copper chaperone